MYKLTLTHSERQAIDWVGYRYWHGDDFYKLLWSECKQEPNDVDWDSHFPITFLIPEHIAWTIRDNLLEDNLACFAPSLVEKLHNFLDKIV